MLYLILYIKIKCMHNGILVKCNNPTKSPQISSFCEERKKPSTLSPILSPTLKTMETNTKNTPSLLPLGSKHTLNHFPCQPSLLQFLFWIVLIAVTFYFPYLFSIDHHHHHLAPLTVTATTIDRRPPLAENCCRLRKPPPKIFSRGFFVWTGSNFANMKNSGFELSWTPLVSHLAIVPSLWVVRVLVFLIF